jgi:hypothetical protein
MTPRQDDLFYFVQCSTVASPRDPNWNQRVKEELYALKRFSEYLKYIEGFEWFTLKPTNQEGKSWIGSVRYENKKYGMELVLKDAYPYTPPAVRIPELMTFTDRKIDDEVLGLRICDMHMDQHYWWNEFCGIALYLKREVSYWVQSVVQDMVKKGWF